MDIGAHDGISYNNTFYFEKNNNWSGFNVEPIHSVYSKLVVNRPNCVNINCAISDVEGTAEFICNKGYTEMISGLRKNYDPRHYNRLQSENDQMGSTTEIITVPTKRIDSICYEYNITHIHYLSIDVEGAEFDVVKSINFEKVFIDVIGFENNYNDTSIPIIQYLERRGYIELYRGGDIFMIYKDSVFKTRDVLEYFSKK
jgi:FkbM family methyltransferase